MDGGTGGGPQGLCSAPPSARLQPEGPVAPATGSLPRLLPLWLVAVAVVGRGGPLDMPDGRRGCALLGWGGHLSCSVSHL